MAFLNRSIRFRQQNYATYYFAPFLLWCLIDDDFPFPFYFTYCLGHGRDSLFLPRAWKTFPLIVCYDYCSHLTKGLNSNLCRKIESNTISEIYLTHIDFWLPHLLKKEKSYIWVYAFHFFSFLYQWRTTKLKFQKRHQPCGTFVMCNVY